MKRVKLFVFPGVLFGCLLVPVRPSVASSCIKILFLEFAGVKVRQRFGN